MTTCTRCGRATDYNVNLELGYAYCERCEADFQASMAEQFPYGQCGRCGCRYEKRTRACEPCYGLGIIPHLAPDGVGVEWHGCRACEQTGEVEVVDGLHEETLCGLREDWTEAMYASGLDRMPTVEDVLGWFIENAAREEEYRARAAVRVASTDPDDIPF